MEAATACCDFSRVAWKSHAALLSWAVKGHGQQRACLCTFGVRVYWSHLFFALSQGEFRNFIAVGVRAGGMWHGHAFTGVRVL